MPRQPFLFCAGCHKRMLLPIPIPEETSIDRPPWPTGTWFATVLHLGWVAPFWRAKYNSIIICRKRIRTGVRPFSRFSRRGQHGTMNHRSVLSSLTHVCRVTAPILQSSSVPTVPGIYTSVGCPCRTRPLSNL